MDVAEHKSPFVFEDAELPVLMLFPAKGATRRCWGPARPARRLCAPFLQPLWIPYTNLRRQAPIGVQ